MTEVVSYVEIDVPHCSLTYSVAPCTASLTASPPTGTIKCFNSLGTCQDRANFTDVPVTFRFCEDLGQIRSDIDAYPFIKAIDFTPAILSLGNDLGQRATLKVVFKDARHSDAGDNFDKYPGDRNYADPFIRGTFWGKFRARNPFLRGREIRLIRGKSDQSLSEMETRYFVIDSIDGPNADGEFSIIAKDILKLADGDRSLAPHLSNGFLVADITNSATSLTLSPAGIGGEYAASGFVAIGGSEIVQFYRDATAGNDANCLLLLHCDGADTSTTFTDSSSSARTPTPNGNAQIDTAQSKFLQAGLFDGTGDFVTFPDSNDWTFSGNFTVDCWARFSSLAAVRNIFGHGSAANTQYRLGVATDGTITFEIVNGGVTVVTMSSAASAIVIDTWYHLAVVRNGNAWNIYRDGVSIATTTDSDAIPNFAGTFRVGADGNSANGMAGWIDEFRVSNIARWTAAFTPPVSPYQTSIDILTLVRGQLNTTAISHSAQDRVQTILRYSGEDPAVIIYDLLVNYAEVSADYIHLGDWQDETAAFLGNVYTLNICEPTSVNALISELIEQMGAVIWWEDISQHIRLQILRSISITAERWNEDNVLANTLEIREQPEKRISEVLVYFAQINPLLKRDETSNYRSTEAIIDAQSELDEGSAAIKKIFARGIAAGGRSVATRVGEKYLSRYVRPPRRFNFELLRYSGVSPALAAGARLGGGDPLVSSWPFQDETGDRVDVPLQVTRHNPKADIHVIEAEEMLFTQFGEIVDTTTKTIIFDANELNINLRTRHDELFPAPSLGDTINCIISTGTMIGSNSTAIPAFDIGSWPTGSPAIVINLTVRGRIEGAGGNGVGTLSAGFPGGPALYTRHAITLDLSDPGAEVWGGGGGGGCNSFLDASGGGAGYVPGAGGDAGSGIVASPGTTEAGGAKYIFGTAGNGGGPGLAGQTDGLSAGGAAGAAIDGVSFCTISSPDGDIRGGQIN